jgi:2-amino-4-hydroxy-6-hydroxymethyldihydropteridine diphosphokinase
VSAQPHLVAIGLGSNLGDSLVLLQQAWAALGACPAIKTLRLSEPYRTRPVGMESPHWFVNAAGLVQTTLPPLSLLTLLHTIEARFGRVRPARAAVWHDRFLDLDLLLYADFVLHSSRLILPHPRMEQRLFVLTPLAEIAGMLVHPVLRQNIVTLRENLLKNVQNQTVEKISWSK